MKKVLLINDCKFESIIMKDLLSNLGYKVSITNEYDALVQTSKFQPDIVIANLVMKSTTGDKVIKNIKQNKSDIICILSSCNLISLEDFNQSEVDQIIHTPIDSKELRETIEKALYKSNKTSFTKESSFKFCPYCGQNLEEMNGCFLFCPYCGEKIK